MIQWFLSSRTVAICVDVLDSLSGVCHGFPFFQTNRYKQSQYDWKIERKKEGPVREIWLGQTYQYWQVVSAMNMLLLSFLTQKLGLSNFCPAKILPSPQKKSPNYPQLPIPHSPSRFGISASPAGRHFSFETLHQCFRAFPPSTAIHTEVFPYKQTAPEDSRNISEASESHVQKASRFVENWASRFDKST